MSGDGAIYVAKIYIIVVWVALLEQKELCGAGECVACSIVVFKYHFMKYNMHLENQLPLAHTCIANYDTI